MHAALLGDSIFDNAAYVRNGLPVIEHLRNCLAPLTWQATLLAVDGHTTPDVVNQLTRLPPNTTHLFVSVGGNDALGQAQMLNQPAGNVERALAIFQGVRSRFRHAYREMLQALLATVKPVTVCTIYDCIPDLTPARQAGVAGFNEVILREAIAAGVAVIDLRLLCDEPSDFSHVSVIEPSETGGEKIARAIIDVMKGHHSRSPIYPRP